MSRPVTVYLAVWLRAHRLYRLEQLVRQYWRLRNWWLNAVWDRHLYRKWRWLTQPFRARCSVCGFDLVQGMCVMCLLKQQEQVSALSPRKRG